MEIIEIDKNVLFESIEAQCGDDEYFLHKMRNLIGFLNRIPTIKKEVNAKWVEKYKSGYKPPDAVVCSHCDYFNFEKEEYCPNCGAKMDI